MSSQRGGVMLRLKNIRPVCQSHSEIVPIGQIQLQNALRYRREIAANAISMNMPAACVPGTDPVSRSVFRFISDAIGSHASTPSGRATLIVVPPLSKYRTHS